MPGGEVRTPGQRTCSVGKLLLLREGFLPTRGHKAHAHLPFNDNVQGFGFGSSEVRTAGGQEGGREAFVERLPWATCHLPSISAPGAAPAWLLVQEAVLTQVYNELSIC